MLRTIAVWNRAPFVTSSLVVVSLGQWGLLLHSITTVRSSWSDAIRTCAVNAVPPKFIKLNYLYSELSARSYGFFSCWVRRFNLRTIYIDYSNVVRLDRPSAHNICPCEVSQPVFPLATAFSTRYHLLPRCIHRQHDPRHLPCTRPQ